MEITEDLPLDVDVALLTRLEDNIVHAQVLLDYGEGPTLVTDVVEDCPHHTHGDNLSTLADFGKDYAELEEDLLGVPALMCDLPEFHDQFERYFVELVAFQDLFCHDGLLAFTFGFRVSDVTVEAYQDSEYEFGE